MKWVLEKFRVIDLSQTLHEGVPTWNGRCGFRLENKLDYENGGIRAQTFKSHAGIGTHMDAPSHFIKGSWNIEDIPLDLLIVPVCILDVKKDVGPDFFLTPKHIDDYEEQYGRIPEKSLVIAYTGWGERFWNEPEKYRNPDASGMMHYPGFSPESADILLERKIAGIGIDSLSPDGSQQGIYPVHEKILGAKKYILENLAHLDQMPPSGAYAIAFPLKIRDATESGARVAGLIQI